MYADHPTRYYPALFSKLPARRRGTVRIQTGAYPRYASNVRACCSRIHATHLSPTRTYIFMYTSIHLPPQRHTAIPCGRTLGSPGRPYIEEARPSSSSLLPSLGRRLRTHLSRSVSGNTLSSASRRAIKFRSNLFQRSTGIAKIFGFSWSRIGDRSPDFSGEVIDGKVKCEHCN